MCVGGVSVEGKNLGKESVQYLSWHYIVQHQIEKSMRFLFLLGHQSSHLCTHKKSERGHTQTSQHLSVTLPKINLILAKSQLQMACVKVHLKGPLAST